MNELIPVVTQSGIPTMSSLEMVEFINSQRKQGEAELRHDHFMTKVPKVLGEASPKFWELTTSLMELAHGSSVRCTTSPSVKPV